MLKTTMLASSMLVHVLDGLLGMNAERKGFQIVVIPGEQSERENDNIIQLSELTPATERMPPANSIPFPFEKSEDSPEGVADGPTNDAEPAYGRGH